MTAANRGPMHIGVLGPGAVGGLLGAVLARGGNTVVFLANPSTAREINTLGLRLESATLGTFVVPAVAADELAAPVDACLVTVKATHLVAALSRVPASWLRRGPLIPFLNGIDHVDMLRTAYPEAAVVAATIRVESSRVQPGVIRHTSPFVTVEMAPSASSGLSAVDPLAGQLENAGITVRLRDDEKSMLWEKLAFLAPFALLTTCARANAGVVRTAHRDAAIAAISEVVAVARHEGAVVDPQRILELLDGVPATMESSMSKDQAAGLELELDAIGGTVVRRGRAAGVPVPVITRLVEDLRARGVAVPTATAVARAPNSPEAG